MRFLVIGAGGMLGRDVARAAEAAGHAVAAATRAEVDVTEGRATTEAVERERPHAVVNCAALTDVDGAEAHPEEALRVNADGAGNVATAAALVGALVVYPSTDYVFDGRKGTPYVESDAPRPLSSYGRSKLEGERATAGANRRHLIVRSSWLFGTGGRNFVETMLRLANEREELVVVEDQVGSPTYAVHLAQGIERLAARRAYGLHHVAGDGACSWFEFAREILRQAEVRCPLRPCSTEEAGRPAPRPAYSVLTSERPDAVRLPHWRLGLESYLHERKLAAA